MLDFKANLDQILDVKLQLATKLVNHTTIHTKL